MKTDNNKENLELFNTIRFTDFYRGLGSGDIQTFGGFMEMAIYQQNALREAIGELVYYREKQFYETDNYPDFFDYVYRNENYIIILSVNSEGGLALIYNKESESYRMQILGEDDAYFFPSSIRVSQEAIIGYLFHVTSTFNNIKL